MSPEERLADLEIRFTHQERVIAALDEVVREFAARVERLERRLAEREAGADAGPVAGGDDEPPPHY